MAMLARPVDPRLCQKLQCGVVSSDELTSDVLSDCHKMGYIGTKSPLADECRQYYPRNCQGGPARAFPDVWDAWPELGPDVSEVAAAWPVMPEQAVALPPPFQYGATDSGGYPMSPALDVPGGGYPYSPGFVYPADQTMQPSTDSDTPIDQMAGPTGPLKWPWHLSADYNTPAAPTPDVARYTILPAGPSTFLRPLPSITPMHGNVSEFDAGMIAQDAGVACRFARWVDQNKPLAVAGLVVAFLALTGGGRGR